jgi:hypothetical protein
LLLELQKCGINCLPIEEDAALCKIGLKDRGAEERAIVDIVTAMRSFAIRSTKWNKEAGDDRVLAKIRENLDFDKQFLEDHEQDWTHVQWWHNKVAFLKATESEPKFTKVNIPEEGLKANDRIPDGNETQSMLIQVIEEWAGEEAKERCF